MKAHIPKAIRKVIVSVIALTLLFVVGGMSYVLVTDQSAPKPASPAVSAGAVQTDPVLKPTPPASNAPEGVSVESVTSPIAAGSNSSITVRTNAGSTCAVTVSYNGAPSTDSGLTPKTADAYGNVTWTWTVNSSVPAGSWPVKVTCTYHGRSGVVISNFQVTK